jgi:hypothetical protein
VESEAADEAVFNNAQKIQKNPLILVKKATTVLRKYTCPENIICSVIYNLSGFSRLKLFLTGSRHHASISRQVCAAK